MPRASRDRSLVYELFSLGCIKQCVVHVEMSDAGVSVRSHEQVKCVCSPIHASAFGGV